MLRCGIWLSQCKRKCPQSCSSGRCPHAGGLPHPGGGKVGRLALILLHHHFYPITILWWESHIPLAARGCLADTQDPPCLVSHLHFSVMAAREQTQRAQGSDSAIESFWTSRSTVPLFFQVSHSSSHQRRWKMRLGWAASASRITLTAERIRIPSLRSMGNIPIGFSPHPRNVARVILLECTGGQHRDPAGQVYLPQGAWPPVTSGTTEKRRWEKSWAFPFRGLNLPWSPQQGKTVTPSPCSGLGFLCLDITPFLSGTQACLGYSVLWWVDSQWPWHRACEHLSCLLPPLLQVFSLF